MHRSWYALFCATLALSIAAAHAGEWRTLRGPGYDGSTTAETPSASDRVALDLVWKQAIGPGYSGVTVANGRAVTAFSDGEHDVVAAWSVADGRELWRVTIGPTYRGHDGSTDGPIGTPSLTDERVYVVGPFGDLLALSADGGALLWRKNLAQEWGAPAPTYGFSTTPLEVQGVLVVTAGGKEHSILGLDPDDGRVLWSTGSDAFGYASPVLIGEVPHRSLVAAGSLDLIGLDPRSGEQLWRFRHSERPPYDPTYPQLQPVGDRLLLTFPSEAVLYDLTDTADGTQVTERWRSSVFKNSVALPVAAGEHLYGFNGTFLTCVAVETGTEVWKTREARGRGLILVDDQLVVFGAAGVLTVAAADPGGYREIASLEVADHGGYTAPSFAGGRVYVRNRDDLASVALRAGPDEADANAGTVATVGTAGTGRPVRTGAAEDPPAVAPAFAGTFAGWARRIEQSSDPASVVQEFLAAQERFPLVEPGWVHFVYVGEAQAVSILGQMNDDELGDPLIRVGSSNLFARSYPAVDGGRWQYRYQVDFAEASVDPRNPLRGSGGFAESSEVLLNGFADPPFVTATAAGAGRVEPLSVTSKVLQTDVAVSIYLPAGFEGTSSYPLVVMPNGTQWTEAGGIVNILDNLFEGDTRRAIVALVPLSNWVAGQYGGRVVTFLAGELLPAIEAAYPIAPGVEQRSLWTVEDKAAVGVTLALAQPETFGRFAFQSPKLYFQETPDLSSLGDRSTAFRVSWSRYEPRSAEVGMDDRAEARRLHDDLREAGVKVEGGEFVAGPGYRTWRAEADAVLNFLLATPAPSISSR